MSEEQHIPYEADLGPPVLPALWAARWRILLAALVAALVGLGVSSLLPVQYEATSELLLADPRNSGVFRDTGTTFLDPSRYVRNQAELAASNSVMQRASELIAGRLDAEELGEQVTVRPSVDLDLLTITATDRTAAGAVQVADAVAQAYQDVVRQQVAENAQSSMDELRAQRVELQQTIAELDAELEADPDDAARRAARDAAVAQLIDIDSRSDQIAVDSALFGAGVELFEEAQLPDGPASPQPLRNAALAFVLGALAMGGLAWWRADETATADDRNDAATILRAPLLGRVPHLEELGAGTVPTVTDPTGPAAEAFHFLVGGLEHALGGLAGRTVLVTSAGPADGKTVTTLNLAIAAAQDGREVILLDADTRRRGLTRRLDIDDAGGGLPELARPEGRLEDVLVPARIDDDRVVPIVPAVDMGDDTAAFFRTPDFRAALEKVRGLADLTLIDSPPMLLASDAAAIAASADGIVVVVQRGTPLRQLEELRDRLDLIGTPVVGYVFTKARLGGDGYYDYKYGYTSAYRAGTRRGAEGNGRLPRSQRAAEDRSRVPRPR